MHSHYPHIRGSKQNSYSSMKNYKSKEIMTSSPGICNTVVGPIMKFCLLLLFFVICVYTSGNLFGYNLSYSYMLQPWGYKDTVSVLTWNIAAINNNPFEYWITSDDKNYNEMMKKGKKLILYAILIYYYITILV